MRTGFVRASVKKFMPGERVEDAIQAAVELKPSGINTILTKLGENIKDLKEAEDVFNHYMGVLALVKKAGIDTQISIKPTQLGYDQNPDLCFDYCMKLLRACEEQNVLFWLDMESSPYVDGTLTLYKRLRAVIAERKVDPKRYEFAMLFGINSARQHELAKSGVKIRCLISYGEYWFPWYMRRLAERPANVWFVMKNMFKG